MLMLLAACRPQLPAPGTVFNGSIEISGTASSGAIHFAISEDGASVTELTITLQDIRCEGMTASSMMKKPDQPYPITNGKFTAAIEDRGEVSGQFLSPTKAAGTITLKIELSVLGSKIVCDMGTAKWSAEAE